MASLNKVMLIGRLTDNPEPPRTLPNTGTTVVKFRFAVGRSKKNPQTGQWENDPNPLYIDCEAFDRPDARRRIGELIGNYARKGSQLYIEGRLQYDTWEDKNGGGKRSKHKIVVDSVELLDKAGAGPGGGAGDGGIDDDLGGGAPPARSNYGNRGAVGRGPAPQQRGSFPAGGDDVPPAGDDGEIPF